MEEREEGEGAPALREPDARTNALSNVVIGAAIEVHRHLGPGYGEAVYEQALCVELRLRGVPFERQKALKVEYKGVVVGEGRLDLLVDGRVVVELKAQRALGPVDRAQAVSYLKASGRLVALLINFEVEVLRDGLVRVIRS